MCRYKVVLEGRFDYDSSPGMASLTLVVNNPPNPGNCTVDPHRGKPLSTKFKVSCKGFHDEDNPLSYEFLYSRDNGTTLESLGNEFQSFRSEIRLPNGDEKYDNKIKFFVNVADSLGAVLKFEISSNVTVSYYSISLRIAIFD